jgi:hypothetical protein
LAKDRRVPGGSSDEHNGLPGGALSRAAGTESALVPGGNAHTARVAEVDLLTGGRFRLGVGIGWNRVEYEAHLAVLRDLASSLTPGVQRLIGHLSQEGR